MMRSTQKTSSAMLAVAVSIGVLVAGCSSGGGDDGAVDSAPSSLAATDTEPPNDGAPSDVDVDVPSATDPVDVTDRSLPVDNAGGESLGPVGSLDLEFDTDEGTVQLGDGEVPESLDPAFPLPDDLAVTISSEKVAEVGVAGTTAWPFDDLVALYEDGLPAAGYEISDLRRPSDGVAVFSFAGSGTSGQVAISAAPNMATTVVVTVTG
jgi:hypothetical protein